MIKPEGKIKAMVKAFLQAKGVRTATIPAIDGAGWYYMPVQGSYGTTGIPDFVGHYKGHFFGIETKAPGKKPTGLQLKVGRSIQNTGAEWFVVNSEATLKDVEAWMEIIDESNWAELIKVCNEVKLIPDENYKKSLSVGKRSGDTGHTAGNRNLLQSLPKQVLYSSTVHSRLVPDTP